MKKFQTLTTVEQSKRLLELGVKPDTADFAYPYVSEHDKDKRYPEYSHPELKEFQEIVNSEKDLPAWSAAALWRLLPYKVDCNGDIAPCELHVHKTWVTNVVSYKSMKDNGNLFNYADTDLVTALYNMLCDCLLSIDVEEVNRKNREETIDTLEEIERKLDKVSEIRKNDDGTRVPEDVVDYIISTKCAKCANYHQDENKCCSFEINNDILTSCIKLELYKPLKKDGNKDEFQLLDYQWLHCHNCQHYDGYDICCKSGNFGTVVNKTIDNCKKNKYYNKKE